MDDTIAYPKRQLGPEGSVHVSGYNLQGPMSRGAGAESYEYYVRGGTPGGGAQTPASSILDQFGSSRGAPSPGLGLAGTYQH